MAEIPVVSLPNSPGWSRWIERLRTATAGRFTIVRELGRGGFAAVFLAQQQQPNRRVAIKLLLPAHLDSTWALDHFRGESQKISEWRHQSVVTIYEVHEIDDLFFCVMSYVEGGSLHELIANNHSLCGVHCIKTYKIKIRLHRIILVISGTMK